MKCFLNIPIYSSEPVCLSLGKKQSFSSAKLPFPNVLNLVLLLPQVLTFIQLPVHSPISPLLSILSSTHHPSTHP